MYLTTWTPLTDFCLRLFQLWPEDWKTLIEAIDVTALEDLDFDQLFNWAAPGLG